ncbi:hypothetical protein C0J52_11414 [Blattella germanica]|nr:hypothetical protein C0J52_11414 [Blattella germanica]
MEKVLVAILLVLVRSGFPQDCPFNCRCTKYKIFCRGTTMRSLPEGRPTTTLLSMKNDVVPFLNQSVVSKPGLANLTTLELIQLNIKIIEPRTFASTRALQSLTISKNTLTDLKPGAFEGLDQLTNLDLSENQMTSITSGVFKGLAALKYLNLASNAIGEVHSGIFDGLSGHKSALKVIDLSVNVISNMDGAAFNGLPSLISLKLMFKNVSSSLVFDSMFSLNRLDMDGYRVALIPSNISTHALYNLRHLHVKNCNFPTLHDRFLEDSKLLTKLYILNSFVKNLDVNCFQGLNSLSELYLHDNQISILTEGVFKNLTTLKILDLSKNYLSGIGETFFLGLDRLVHLNVTKNFLYSIEKNAFSSLHSLKELVLYTDNTEITESFEDLYVTYAHGVHVVYSVDPGSFAGLFSLKSLQVPFNSRPSTVNVTLQSLGRLDTFLGPENFAPHNFQVINTLGFKISKKVNSSQVKNWFRQVPHIKQQVTLEIYDLESFAELSTFSDFNVSNLVVSSCQDGYIANNSFEGLSQLRSLLIRSLQQIILERGAFRNVRNLQHIQIYSVLIAPGVFQELGMLEKLIVGHEYIVSRTIVLTTDYLNGLKHIKVMILRNQNIQGIGSGIKLENLEKFDLSYNIISSLNESVFLGMPKIQTIDLSYNNISTLEVGAFLGLRDIKTINMMHNKRIESIGAGIFGAICDDNFTLTCANLTRLSVYCNSSFALETLTTLDLQFDSIEFIHPHAFLGCNNLKKLTLTGNKIQTLDFLYTPQLRYFYFSYNVNESLIKNNSFSCTSQLADIHFNKTKAKFMSANVFKPLNHLEHLHFPDAEIDCVLHENWQWIRSRNVPYSIPPKMEISLLNLECKDRADFIVQPKQHSSTGDEYIYFKMYIEPIVFIFIFLSGCFGNGLLLFVVFRHSDMRNKKEQRLRSSLGDRRHSISAVEHPTQLLRRASRQLEPGRDRVQDLHHVQRASGGTCGLQRRSADLRAVPRGGQLQQVEVFARQQCPAHSVARRRVGLRLSRQHPFILSCHRRGQVPFVLPWKQWLCPKTLDLPALDQLFATCCCHSLPQHHVCLYSEEEHP